MFGGLTLEKANLPGGLGGHRPRKNVGFWAGRRRRMSARRGFVAHSIAAEKQGTDCATGACGNIQVMRRVLVIGPGQQGCTKKGGWQRDIGQSASCRRRNGSCLAGGEKAGTEVA